MSKKMEEMVEQPMEQAVENAEKNANKTVEAAVDAVTKNDENPTAITDSKTSEPVVVKKGGSGIALLALLVALGVGGAGYYFGSQKLMDVETKLQEVAQKSTQVSTVVSADQPSFEKEKAQLDALTEAYQNAQNRISQLEQAQSGNANQIMGFQSQVQRLGNMPQADNSAWILSDAYFLLNNAMRKLVIDTDVETAKNLLVEADNALSKMANPQIMAVKNAIKADLANLNSLNQVDQNALMQRLTTLANRLDDLPMLDNEAQENQVPGGVSDSIDDWQQNIEKTANSFLDRFIRVSDKNKVDDKGFIAPNQEIYLRENIRLRLQIAILAIPRQQNELYKQSLDAVSTWIRSYFDTQNENVKNFLKALDELSEQSIYIDVPEKLQSLTLLNGFLNKVPQTVEKIEIKEEKALVEPASQNVETVVPSEQSTTPATEVAQ